MMYCDTVEITNNKIIAILDLEKIAPGGLRLKYHATACKIFVKIADDC